MKYKGKELDVFKSDENVAFNPSKEMIVWDDEESKCRKTKVLAYTSGISFPVITLTGTPYRFCAEIPKITNWDEYQERRNVAKLSLECGIEVFKEHDIPCVFCSASEWRNVAENGFRSCTEAKDETAGNV